MRSVRAIKLWVCAVILCLSSLSDAGAVYTVGAGVGCDFVSIQDAVDAAAADGVLQVRIARSQTYTAVALDLTAASITLTGGYDTCASESPVGRTLLNGVGGTADAVIDISNAAAQVTLRNLSITGGDPSAGSPGGGIQILGNNQVALDNVQVYNNQSDRGAGIYVDGGLGAALIIDQDSVIFSNTASLSGGGIHCTNMEEPQFIYLEGDLFDNEAVNGGGVYLDNCEFLQNAINTGDGIFLNRATGSGGGAYLTNGSNFNLSGAADALSVLSLNSATLDGGGIYVTGNASAGGWRTQMIDNAAGRDGGGVFLDSGDFSLNGAMSFCRLQRCSRLESNHADGRGGAIYQLGGRVFLRQTWILDNSSPDGSLIKSEGGTSYLENVIAAENSGATSVMRLKNGDSEIYFSTFADNRDMNATLLLTGGSLKLKGSIIWETSGQAVDFFGAATTTEFDCLLMHNFPVPVTRSTSSDPLFVDPSGGNYHLQMTSPAVDFCFNFLGPPLKGPINLSDIDGDRRAFDVPTVVNEFGSFDLGADEWVDDVFADGFEDPTI